MKAAAAERRALAPGRRVWRRLHEHPLAGLALSVALAFAVNAGSLRNDFSMDDISVIKRDETIRSLANVPALFSHDYWYPKMISGLYRPLVKTSYALNHAAGGLEPRGYQLANLCLHGAVTALLWSLFRRASGSTALATGAAALFAVHAVHTEVTANAAYGRPELMGALFFLLALNLYTGDGHRSRGRAATAYVGSLLGYGAALLSKESAVTLIGVVALWDLCFRTEPTRPLGTRLLELLRRRGPRYTGYVAVTLAYLAARALALEGGRALPPEIALDNPLFGLPAGWRIVNALWVSLHYGRLLLFPLHLSYDYSYDQIPTFQVLTEPRAWAGIAAWIALLAGWLWSLRRSPIVFFGLGFLLATFSVVSNVVVPIGTILGERLLYLPSAGLCLVLAVGARRLARLVPRPEAVFAGAMALGVVLHGIRSVERIPDWVDQWTLFTRDVARSPDSAKTHNNAGAAYLKLGRYEEGILHLRRAIEIQPYGYSTPWATAGLAYTTLGRDGEAREMYEGAIRNGTGEPAVYNNLGFVLVDQGIDVPRGVELLEEAAAKWPDDPEVLDSLGWAYYKLGRLEEAREKLRHAVELPGREETIDRRRAHLREVRQALRRRTPPAPLPDGSPEP